MSNRRASRGDWERALGPAGGTSMGNSASEVRAECPPGTFAISGGGYWDFPSGTLSGVRL